MSTVTETGTVWHERYERAVAFLDRHQPGWRDRIDLDQLDIADGGHCIAAQAFGGYSYAEDAAKNEAGLTEDDWLKAAGEGNAPWTTWGIEHAFLPDDTLTYSSLDALWRDALRSE